MSISCARERALGFLSQPRRTGLRDPQFNSSMSPMSKEQVGQWFRCRVQLEGFTEEQEDQLKEEIREATKRALQKTRPWQNKGLLDSVDLPTVERSIWAEGPREGPAGGGDTTDCGGREHTTHTPDDAAERVRFPYPRPA